MITRGTPMTQETFICIHNGWSTVWLIHQFTTATDPPHESASSWLTLAQWCKVERKVASSVNGGQKSLHATDVFWEMVTWCRVFLAWQHVQKFCSWFRHLGLGYFLVFLGGLPLFKNGLKHRPARPQHGAPDSPAAEGARPWKMSLSIILANKNPLE